MVQKRVQRSKSLFVQSIFYPVPCIWPVATLTISSQRDFIWIFKVFLTQTGCTPDIKWQEWSKDVLGGRKIWQVFFAREKKTSGTQDKVILEIFIKNEGIQILLL